MAPSPTRAVRTRIAAVLKAAIGRQVHATFDHQVFLRRECRCRRGLTALTTRDRFGHPKALSWFFATETRERFSCYTAHPPCSHSIMAEYLLRRGHAANVLGLASFRTALETVFRPLTLQSLTSPSLPDISGNQCFLS